MAAVDFDFTTIQTTGGLREALVEATMDTDDTIDLTAEEFALGEVKHVSGQVAATGAPLTFAHADGVLTLSTASITEGDAVIRVLYA